MARKCAAQRQDFRLIPEGVSDPVLGVVGSLKLNLKSLPGHAPKQAVLVGHTKGLKKSNRF